MQGPPRRLAPRRPGFVSRAPASLATVRTLVAPGVAGRVNPRDCRLTPRRPEFVSCTLASLASKRAFEAPMVAEGVIPRDCQRELRRPEVAWESPRAAMVRTMLARIRVPRTCLSRHGEGLGGGRRLLEGQQAPAAPLRAPRRAWGLPQPKTVLQTAKTDLHKQFSGSGARRALCIPVGRVSPLAAARTRVRCCLCAPGSGAPAPGSAGNRAGHKERDVCGATK
jgi:hypothetical protein